MTVNKLLNEFPVWLRGAIMEPGVYWGPQAKFVGEDEFAGIVKIPGHSYASGRSTQYAQVTYYYFPKDDPTYGGCLEVHTGRPPKEWTAKTFLELGHNTRNARIERANADQLKRADEARKQAQVRNAQNDTKRALEVLLAAVMSNDNELVLQAAEEYRRFRKKSDEVTAQNA